MDLTPNLLPAIANGSSNDLLHPGHVPAMLEAMGVAVYTTDPEGRLTFYNAAAAALWGWSPPLREQRWCGSWRIYRPDGALLPHDQCPMGLCLAEGRPIRGVWAYAERPDGSRVPIAPFPTPMRDAAGRMIGAVNVLVDISGLRAAEAARAATEARFQAVQEVSPDGFLVLDACRNAAGEPVDFTIAYANPTAAGMLGAHRDSLDGALLSALQCGDKAWANGLVGGFLEVLRTRQSLLRELRYEGPEGPVWISSRAVPLGDGVAVALEDITARCAAQERIRELRRQDPLTGLANRHSFQAALTAALSDPAATSVGVLLLDLDEFRRLNDTLGHSAGDEVLRAVAGRLSRAVPEGALVARLGSDEFAILLGKAELAETAEVIARQLLGAISRRISLGRYRTTVTASIGVALGCPAVRDEGPDALLREATLALRNAKTEGRNRSRLFQPALAAASEHRRRLEIALQNAIPSRALSLAYQPVFDLQTEQAIGFEALLRWRHPEHGMVPPGEFIGIAEETGLIVPIGEWVLKRACADAAQWPAGMKVAVNLSPVQFVGGEVAEAVRGALRAARLAPERLELEITESVLLQQSEQVAETLRRLRRMGVRIALDDFGTGYASLSYLRGFAFDKIKIDQSFVRDAVDRADCRAIVRSVAGLAAELGMIATAEGVEGPEHLAMVRGAGCAEAQGYHLGRPAPLAQLGPWLSRP